MTDASADSVSARPDALGLVSPAVSLVKDGWVQRLLMGRGRRETSRPTRMCARGFLQPCSFRGTSIR